MPPDARQDKLIEALSVGATTWLACESSAVRMEEYNNWINDPVTGPAWKERVVDAEFKGKLHRETVDKMRNIIIKHDEAWTILMKQAEHFREFKKKQAGGVQMGLLP